MGEGRALAPSEIERAGAITITSEKGALAFERVGEMMDFAKLMAASDKAVPRHLRNNPGACLAIVVQSNEWGFSPYAVAQKSYEVGDRIAYEAQLLHAVIEKRAPLKQRLRFDFEGEGPDRQVIVTGHFRGEVEPVQYKSPKIRDIKVKNSPLWLSDPDQQFCYYGSRAFGRRYCPDVILGLYSSDEIIPEETGGAAARDVTPVPEDQSLRHRLSMKAAASAGFDPAGIAATMSEVSAGPAPASTNAPGVAPGGQAAASEASPRLNEDTGISPATGSSAAAEPSPGGEVVSEVSVLSSDQQAAAVSQSAVAADPPETSPAGDDAGSSAQGEAAQEAGASSIGDAPAEPAPWTPPPVPQASAPGSAYVEYVREWLKSPDLKFESEARKFWGSAEAKKLRNSLPNLTTEDLETAKALVTAHIKSLSAES